MLSGPRASIFRPWLAVRPAAAEGELSGITAKLGGNWSEFGRLSSVDRDVGTKQGQVDVVELAVA